MQKQVLVVDDDPLYRDLVRDVLALHEIEVLSAPDGVTALLLLKTHSPSLIVSDFEMPGMNGLEFHSHLREDEKTRSIPFVFFTASADVLLSQYTKRHGLRLFNKNNLVNELLSLSSDFR